MNSLISKFYSSSIKMKVKIKMHQNVFQIKVYPVIGKDGEIVTQELDAQDGPVIATFRF